MKLLWEREKQSFIMIKYLFVFLFYIISVSFIILVDNISSESINDERSVFIIYMGSLPKEEYSAQSHHISLLQTLGHENKIAEEILLRSYGRSFNGFAANLTQEEVSKLKSEDKVISVFKSHRYHVQTTRSWDNVGLSLDVSRNPKIESDIIIGHLDTGVFPQSHSFSDDGLADIPRKWKGVCQGGKNFRCNKKLIGARFYSRSKDAIDREGHGTHTASTAAGRILKNANFYGIANGTARGGVPSARIATYKVCNDFCDGHDVMAGFDDAIADNVDIITVSLNLRLNMSDDAISIGSFHAMEKNILTVNSAGNDGLQGNGTRVGIAPWVFTVAASKDRNIYSKLVLGNGRTLLSNTVNVFNVSSLNTTLVDGRKATRHCNESIAIKCTIECIDPSLVKGKIILCDAHYDIDDVESIVANAGASGIILRERWISRDVSDIVSLPTAILNDSDFQYVESYLKSQTLHSARIINSYLDQIHSPIRPYFSNKGPNKILPGIFKPDISAPGVNILAAFPPSLDIVDPVKSFARIASNYSFMSGTSMACPHVAGAAAYVKSKHLDWSVSAIKSSLMTTARNMNGKHNLYAELGHGAGHIDPVKATYPGLVYETFIDDYYKMFCSLADEGDNLRRILRGKKCSKGFRILPKDLNYPAMTSPVHTNSSFTIQFLRKVTNVGKANSTYHAEISSDEGAFNVKVEPNVLSFTHLKERKIFVVTINGKWLNQDHVSSSLIWYDGTHTVRSPIILYRSTLL